MKILVTGGDGFIGSNLVDHFLVSGHEGNTLLNKIFEWMTPFAKYYYMKI
ncbi:MAG: NAD-dependent epimerase/dehydratase family protein [Melioribacteraceae bacterium]|nr:NAD-dependent epimerase/dehydratase family protein [Saprospiraceae bacterium]MCF8355758.1 NAD-dependent epimerase/dehydratase family protein [Melioribacteraceae bacterium]MCF8394786.1 NAD-dependent epimerase/dehydratase family protein [Melioribacteraceae bacterium]